MAQSTAILEVVLTVDRLRTLTQQHPELRAVAEELWNRNGTAPKLRKEATGGLVGARQPIKRMAISPARRKALSRAAKARWAKAKKAGKNTIGGAD